MIEAKHISELNRIINSIKEGNDETKKFLDYLTELCSISDQSYSSKTWPLQWRKTVYDFGRIFLTKDAVPYLKITNNFLSEDNPCEIAAFFNSEIVWNYYEDASEYNKLAIKNFISLFPHNPEFHNNYGIFLASNHNFERAFEEHKVAIRLNDDNGVFINNYTLAVKQYFEYLLEKNNVNKAEELIKEATKFVEETKYDGMGKWEQLARLNSLRDRLNDFQIVLDSVSKFKGDIEAKIRGEQKRLIEVLGIFSAVIAFILTNITIAIASLDTSGVLSLMFGMALVLMIFSASISILFSPKRRRGERLPFLNDNRFWTIILLAGALLLWIWINNTYQNNNDVTIQGGETTAVDVLIKDSEIINTETASSS